MKATAASPLSPTASQSSAPAASLSGIFGYFCFPDKNDSPISLRSKRGETALSGFCASKTASAATPAKTPNAPGPSMRATISSVPACTTSRSPSTTLVRTVPRAIGPLKWRANRVIRESKPCLLLIQTQMRVIMAVFSHSGARVVISGRGNDTW